MTDISPKRAHVAALRSLAKAMGYTMRVRGEKVYLWSEALPNYIPNDICEPMDRALEILLNTAIDSYDHDVAHRVADLMEPAETLSSFAFQLRMTCFERYLAKVTIENIDRPRYMLERFCKSVYLEKLDAHKAMLMAEQFNASLPEAQAQPKPSKARL